MAVPPVRGQPYTFCLGLASQANNGLFQDSPTIAPGDVVVVRDTTVLGNITTLPSALVGCTRLVQVTVSADEMDGGQTLVLFHDAAGDEWKDVLAIIDTAAQTLDTVDANIDSILALIAALNDLSAAEVNAEVVDALATVDKTGYKLASDGLDSVSITAPSGVASNFREMVVQLWRRFFKKATMTSASLVTYADDGTTAITTQELSDDGTTQTQGESL